MNFDDEFSRWFNRVDVFQRINLPDAEIGRLIKRNTATIWRFRTGQIAMPSARDAFALLLLAEQMEQSRAQKDAA